MCVLSKQSMLCLGCMYGTHCTRADTEEVIRQLRLAEKNKKISAVVLRVDSPGGDALASDIMWREIVALAKKKPVIASMV